MLSMPSETLIFLIEINNKNSQNTKINTLSPASSAHHCSSSEKPRILLLTEKDLNRCPGKMPLRSQFVFQETFVGIF